MFLASFWMLVCVLCAVRGQRGRPSRDDNDDSSGFQITSFNGRRTDGSRDQRPSSSRLSSSDAQSFPDFVRIEVDIQRLDNPQGKLSSGQACDFSKTCDTRLSAYMDFAVQDADGLSYRELDLKPDSPQISYHPFRDNPLSPFPGSVPVSKWATVFDGKKTNSPAIGKVVTQDLCGGSTSNVNLRARAVDVDTFSADDEINTFECVFPLSPDLIDSDALNARWTSPKQCSNADGNNKSGSRLFTRMRAYQIPSTSCHASQKKG